MDTVTTHSENLNEKHGCSKCGIYFEDANSLDMHTTLHSLTEAEMTLRRNLLYQEVRKQQNDTNVSLDDQITKIGHKPRRIYKPKSKRLGLTKVRMEDCLRCDACSCIYIQPADYYKHMRNFHQRYNTIIPRCRKKSPVRTKEVDYRAEDAIKAPMGGNPSVPIADSGTDKQIREKIKIRWSEVVSQRLLPRKNLIKTEPEQDVDMSLLLSNVEVTIKLEPPEVS